MVAVVGRTGDDDALVTLAQSGVGLSPPDSGRPPAQDWSAVSDPSLGSKSRASEFMQ